MLPYARSAPLTSKLYVKAIKTQMPHIVSSLEGLEGVQLNRQFALEALPPRPCDSVAFASSNPST
jgi:hypothetical protein